MRNETITLTGETLARSTHYASVVKGMMDGSGSTVAFRYTKRDGTVSHREAVPTAIVGTAGLSTYGFLGETDAGPRTFNFHLMG